MSFALNEVEATAKRATRGAGYPWGLAEEASKATRWLCAQGLDGVSVLAAVLQGETKPVSTISQGAALSDRAAGLKQADASLGEIAEPLMILPFAAMAARQLEQTVTVACAKAKAVTDGSLVSISGEFPKDADLVVQLGGRLDEARTKVTRATPDKAAWEALNALAHRTYAPATEESRRLGAGAGLSDND